MQNAQRATGKKLEILKEVFVLRNGINLSDSDLEKAAFDMLDYYKLSPDQFYDIAYNEFAFDLFEIETIYDIMKEIIEERTKPLIF